MSNSKKIDVRLLIIAALMLALAILLPQIFGRIQFLGTKFLPMHIPVLLCGFICGPTWGMAVGAATPLLRSVVFGAPAPFMPTAVAMAFELAAYGFIAGMLYKKLNKNIFLTYLALITAMVGGRLVWGLVMFVLIFAGQAEGEVGFMLIWSRTVLNCIPGIILQLVAIPPIITVLRKNRLMLN